MNKKVENLGQVFTKEPNVLEMLHLIKNKKGKLLEPSAGEGIFLENIEKHKNILNLDFKEIKAFEIDSELKKNKLIENNDFFKIINEPNFINKRFNTIIGNPPYVKYKNIDEKTKNLLNMDMFDERSNLYLFFIKEAVEKLEKNGELIFLVPRDFLKATSAIKMNNWLYSLGTFTHIIDYGDNSLFDGFSPNCIVFRYEKGNFKRDCLIKKYNKGYSKDEKMKLSCINGQYIFSKEELSINATDLFLIKVGAVSGADDIFESENGNILMVGSETNKKNKLKKFFYNVLANELIQHKEVLLKRKIKKFNEKNWYEWGRRYYESNKQRIYVNAKTRNKNPFFMNDCKAYDGSILALFPKKDLSKKEMILLTKMLNKLDWESLGFLCGNRYLFSQRALSNLKFPKEFEKFKK